MFRCLLQVCAGLIVVLAGGAAAAPAPHFAAPPVPGRGSIGRSPAPALRSGPLPRGGPGTLGQYYGRSPSVRGGPRFIPYPYYLAPYYGGLYFSPFPYDSFYDDGFYPNDWAEPYPPGYAAPEGWSKHGNVQLHVDPKDVEVIVDGIPTANSGRAVLDLPTGPHHIEIRHSGYRPWVLDLDVKQGVRYQLDQRLERLTKEEQQSGADQVGHSQWGELRLNVKPDDTIVDMDGRVLGMVDLLRGSQALHRLPPGPHTFRFSRPGYQTVEKQIEITPDRPAEVTLDLQRG